jgi:formate hydrogenlyase subunit 6/NADH:ubiquinone oxidoreductase subunit I
MEKGSVTRIKDAPLCDKNGYPRLVDSIEKCCGCAACCAICPKNAIRMDADEEGFFYPVVDTARCVQCYRCLDICVFKT